MGAGGVSVVPRVFLWWSEPLEMELSHLSSYKTQIQFGKQSIELLKKRAMQVTSALSYLAPQPLLLYLASLFVWVLMGSRFYFYLGFEKVRCSIVQHSWPPRGKHLALVWPITLAWSGFKSVKKQFCSWAAPRSSHTVQFWGEATPSRRGPCQGVVCPLPAGPRFLPLSELGSLACMVILEVP